DLSPLVGVLQGLQAGIDVLGVSQPDIDLSSVTEGLDGVESAVRDLIARPIPVPETPLPFVNEAGNATQARLDSLNRIIVGNAPTEDVVTGNASNTVGTSTSVIAAQGAGKATYVTDVAITNTSANDIYVELKDGT